jgi:hypothetical protein
LLASIRVPSPPDSRFERRAKKLAARRRRRRSLFAAAALCCVAAAVVAAVADGDDGSHSARAPHHARRPRRNVAPRGVLPGLLLIADRGNNRMLLVDSRKRVLWRYPRPGRPVAMPLRFDDDTFFGPGFTRIISNQEDQHTIQVIAFPNGRLLWRYGHVDVRGSAAGYLNTPDDAYLLSNGLVSVADAYNCRVLFLSRSRRVVREIGRAGSCVHDPPRSLGPVNGATPLHDGGVLVSETTGSWIDDIGPHGRLRWSIHAPVSYPSDPQLVGRNRILLADYSRPGRAIVMTTKGRVVWSYGPREGPGELDHPSLALRIARNLIAINDDYRDRVVVIDMRTRRIVWQYGHTDRPGTRNGFLHTPDGLDLLPWRAASNLRALRRLLAPPSVRTHGVG